MRARVVGAGLAGLLASFLLTSASPAPQADAKFEAASALVAHAMRRYHVPGAALGVLRDGAVKTRGFGVTNVDNPQPVAADTLFALASISKTVTATAVMRLAQTGKIDLDAPIRTYLPDFNVQDPAASRTVTMRYLLTHTPGWEGQLTVPDRGVDTLAAFVASLRDLPQLSPPGAVWSYNNAGFAVAGRVIEVVTGKPFADAAADLVFTPMRLQRATLSLGQMAAGRFAVGHRDRDGRTEVARPFLLSTNPPAGGVAMHVGDLMTYARAHLTDATLAPMRVAQLRKNGTDDQMGIGWQLRTIGGVHVAMHGGTAAGGLCLLLELVPDRAFAFAILTNHADGWRLIQDVEREILRTYLDLSLAPNQAIAHRGVNEAMTHASALPKQPDPDEYVGTYLRPPLANVTVRTSEGRLLVNNTPIQFFAPDRAFQLDQGAPGVGVEFIRAVDGKVAWIRVNGRVARRNASAASPAAAQSPAGSGARAGRDVMTRVFGWKLAAGTEPLGAVVLSVPGEAEPLKVNVRDLERTLLDLAHKQAPAAPADYPRPYGTDAGGQKQPVRAVVITVDADHAQSVDAAVWPAIRWYVDALARLTPISSPDAIPADARQRVAAAIPRQAPAAPKKTRRLLVLDLAYNGSFYHSSTRLGNLSLQLMSDATGAFTPVFSNDLENLHYPKITEFDGVFLNQIQGDVFDDDLAIDGLTRYVREGGGVAGLHAATWASQSVAAFGDLMGATSGAHKYNGEPGALRIDDPASPLTGQFEGKGFELFDEFYHYASSGPYSREKLHVLLSLDPARTDLSGNQYTTRPDNDYGLAWIRTYGRGRVFTCGLGHRSDFYEAPRLQQLLLAGIQYILGDLDADATPSGRIR